MIVLKRPSQTADKFIVRLPDGMRDQISAAATANGRSMTAEVVLRLEQSFRAEGASPAAGPVFSAPEPQDVATQVRALEARVTALEDALKGLKALKALVKDVGTRGA